MYMLKFLNRKFEITMIDKLRKSQGKSRQYARTDV